MCVRMGSCCSAGSPVTSTHRGLEASATASSSSVVDPLTYHPAVGVAPGVGVGVAPEDQLHRHVPPQDSAELPYAVTPEPQQLEHIADREGKRERERERSKRGRERIMTTLTHIQI